MDVAGRDLGTILLVHRTLIKHQEQMVGQNTIPLWRPVLRGVLISKIARHLTTSVADSSVCFGIMVIFIIGILQVIQVLLVSVKVLKIAENLCPALKMGGSVMTIKTFLTAVGLDYPVIVLMSAVEDSDAAKIIADISIFLLITALIAAC